MSKKRLAEPTIDVEPPLYVWGAKDIGETINWTERQVFHGHRVRILPTFNAGGKIGARYADLADPAKWPKQSKDREPRPRG